MSDSEFCELDPLSPNTEVSAAELMARARWANDAQDPEVHRWVSEVALAGTTHSEAAHQVLIGVLPVRDLVARIEAAAPSESEAANADDNDSESVQGSLDRAARHVQAQVSSSIDPARMAILQGFIRTGRLPVPPD
ncbi:MAG: hypothetical protein L0G99_15515 [Propionibacteriales bacterium]|nr:hypothetical protein [Propionibacteriales bacterium]